MSKKLQDKVALVSGSGRGIGREIALKLASEGARVVINDLDADPAQQTVAEIIAAGGQAVACIGSVTEAGFADRFVKTALDTYGGLDIIVNNAGYTWDNVVQKMSDEQWEAMLAVHLTAPFRILRAASAFIREASRREADEDATIDIAGQQIKVGVNPQILKNAESLIPLGRGGTPEEAAGAVYLFCIPESNYVSGQVLVCGGGRP
ncbi:MAG: SDR family oxidoreductase [Betaproteobacteria bacterium]|nr:SDR family oxidoreductase [Betaproteobacteria bacterium]